MIIDFTDFEIDLDKLMAAFARLIQDMGLDDTDDQQVYNTITVFLTSLIAVGLKEEYGDNPARLEEQVKATCQAITEDLEEKIRAFLSDNDT